MYSIVAEVELRQGNAAAAEALLNKVPKRYYPADSPSLYPENGSVLTMQEMLDEWGREFLGEGRRRTDLIRFGKYTDAWWDKPKTNSSKEILPLSRTVLGANPNLVQNPGYESI